MLTPLLLALATPAAPPAPPPPGTAPSAQAAMIDLPAGAAEGQRCLPDGRCLEVRTAGAAGPAAVQLVVHYPAADGREDAVLDLPFTAGEWVGADLWPHAILLPTDDATDTTTGEDSRIIGVIVTARTMYSGGGGAGGRLHLLLLGGRGSGVPRLEGELLDIVWDSDLMIRACFSERDMRERRGACHDEYAYHADLAPAPQPGGNPPDLRYTAVATSYPRTARRDQDSSDQPRLTRADLTAVVDSECSYTRLLRFNPATSRYEMERPAPDCSAYTTP